MALKDIPDKIYQVIAYRLKDMLSGEKPEDSISEMPEKDLTSNCCGEPFGYPGWPDNDICSGCGEHADIWEDK